MKLALKTHVNLNRKDLFLNYEQWIMRNSKFLVGHQCVHEWENKVKKSPGRVILLVFAAGYLWSMRRVKCNLQKSIM
jgi:hypothetical protein